MRNILVIDDDAELFALLHDYFQGTEFHLEHAVDAETGLSRLQVAPGAWDAVILDGMFPGMSGMEALGLLRASPESGALPVLMLTALGAEEEKVAGLEAGADDYLAKPFGLAELAARLRALLRRSTRSGAPRPDHGGGLPSDDLDIDSVAMTVRIGNRIIRLTPTEMRLMEVFVTEQGRTVSRDKLTKCLFTQLDQRDYRGLDMAISRLRRKLGRAGDGGERLRGVWGVGYVLVS